MFLEVQGLTSGYGDIEVLHGLDLKLDTGQILAVLGANGAGKSTLLKTLVGLVKAVDGSVRLDSHEIKSLSTEGIVRSGMTLVPEGRMIFETLSVLDNLRIGSYPRTDKIAIETEIDELMSRFPILSQRRNQLAGTLSGGEQQQLAICRALMSNPRVLLLDEPSLGLAPVIVDQVFALIRELRKERWLAIVIVEQNMNHALAVADDVCIMKSGRIVVHGKPDEIMANEKMLKASYLGGASS